ncbi:MAG: hypothetical protein CL767_05170 [Chloroflexi bacterium]|nr:hypothetical protein [Chloroflexota bacterium]
MELAFREPRNRHNYVTLPALKRNCAVQSRFGNKLRWQQCKADQLGPKAEAWRKKRADDIIAGLFGKPMV